jgi:hypothetical protein
MRLGQETSVPDLVGGCPHNDVEHDAATQHGDGDSVRPVRWVDNIYWANSLRFGLDLHYIEVSDLEKVHREDGLLTSRDDSPYYAQCTPAPVRRNFMA